MMRPKFLNRDFLINALIVIVALAAFFAFWRFFVTNVGQMDAGWAP